MAGKKNMKKQLGKKEMRKTKGGSTVSGLVFSKAKGKTIQARTLIEAID